MISLDQIPKRILITSFLCLVLAAHGAEPIIHVEAEAGEGAGAPAAMGNSSGGKILRYIAPQFRRTLPLA